ncbi:DUF368 domain-containing protein [Microbacterium halophytorum]|uniref:DUF368 domain-containing protein n=1 Tax=Microbacterium halophytorum TaxID=2067568 RepID=UPI000CFD989C|nr:DUF368 domain-containing protein [Microbacterium halophytorum]
MTSHTTARRSGPRQAPLTLLRGFLIGLAELVPGVSGGTIALVTGVYERAMTAALMLGRALRVLVTGPNRAAGFRENIRSVDWWLAAPLLVGMAVAVLFGAGTVSALVEANPENARGLFFGLVAASLIVPIRMLPEGTGKAHWLVDALAVLIAGVAAFLLVGLASNTEAEDPAWWFVMLAAAVAVCALVVPGVSGSFFLLAIGLYGPTLTAVDERDWAYIGVFAVGALVGLVTIVKGITVLLARARRTTLLVMLGLMLGSLRALWPWQGGQGGEDGHGTLLAPTDPAGPILFAVLGAVVVLTLVAVEAAMERRAR